MRKIKFHNSLDEKLRSNIKFRNQLRIMTHPELGFIKAIVVNTLAVSLLGLGVPLATQLIINNIGVRTMTQPLVIMCVLLLFILSTSGILQTIQIFTVEILQRRLFVRYGLVLVERIIAYQEKHFKKANSPDLINRYHDILIIQSAMIIFFVNGFGFIMQFVIGFALLAVYHPYFLGFAGFMGQFLFVNWMLFGPGGVNAGAPESNSRYDVISWVEELSRVRNIFTSDNGKDFSRAKINHLFNVWLKSRNHLFHFQFLQNIGLQIFGVIMNVLLLGMGGFLVLKQELSAGQLVAAALVVNGIIANLPSLQSFFFSVYNYSSSLDQIAQFYDYPLEEPKANSILPEKLDFELVDLKFSPNYHFNFGFKEGSRNLVLVRSFSSIDLVYDAVMGHGDHVSGDVKINGNLIDDVDLGQLRNCIQIISHDQFFAGTVKENIIGLTGGHNITQTQINEVLGRVGLLENIKSLPDGVETKIRPNGYPFSRSQILAIQVARALIQKPRILFVTPDYEQISSFKRKLIYQELLAPENQWTLLFFTQRFYRGDFDRYVMLERSKLTELTSEAEFLKEIETNA